MTLLIVRTNHPKFLLLRNFSMKKMLIYLKNLKSYLRHHSRQNLWLLQ